MKKATKKNADRTNFSREMLRSNDRETLIAVGVSNGKKRADLMRLSRETLIDAVYYAQKE